MENKEKSLRLEVFAGLALAGATALALIFANSSLAEFYQILVSTPFEIRLGDASLTKPVLLWINDGLMAVFFLFVTLELKREVIEGELSSLPQVVLPLVGSIGGIVSPALIYLLCVGGAPTLISGWAIPIATDIAFALGVLSIFGRRVPRALKAFLLTLAVFDDLGAILIIALVYTGNISWAAKGLALVFFLLLITLNRLRVTRLAPYCLLGALMWLCVLKSGVHATLAGVLLGLTIPLRLKDSHGQSPLYQLEHGLHPWVSFLILPLFAFANAGVSFAGVTLGSLFQPLTLGIILGLFLGKSLGVFGFSYFLIRIGKAKLPDGTNWLSFFGVAAISGIGFTMSLFIGTLAFESSWEQLGAPIRLGVLCGSLIAALCGASILFVGLKRSKGVPK